MTSFLTAGPDEVRAWPIPDGSNAVDAAGAIHTDLARGFIRAETIAYDELLAAGSMAEAKRHGKVRSEGKTYRVKDGDVERSVREINKERFGYGDELEALLLNTLVVLE